MTQTQHDGQGVCITHSGNLLEVRPPMQHLLDPILSYTHRHTAPRPGQADKISVSDEVMYRLENNALYTYQGALSEVRRVFNESGIDYTYTDLRPANPRVEPDYDSLKLAMPNLQFRIKQKDIIAHIIGCDYGQIVAPTAYGKTFIMLVTAALFPKANIIMASPSVSLLDSTYRRMRQITYQVGRIGGGRNEPDRITLTTMRSLEKCDLHTCDILIIDESHKAAAPCTAKTLCTLRNVRKVFGLSATPEGRADGADVVTRTLVGPVLYEVEYQEAKDAGIVADLKVVAFDMPEGCCTALSSKYSTRIAKKRNLYWRNDVRNKKFADAVNAVPASYGMDDPQVLIGTHSLTQVSSTMATVGPQPKYVRKCYSISKRVSCGV